MHFSWGAIKTMYHRCISSMKPVHIPVRDMILKLADAYCNSWAISDWLQPWCYEEYHWNTHTFLAWRGLLPHLSPFTSLSEKDLQKIPKFYTAPETAVHLWLQWHLQSLRIPDRNLHGSREDRYVGGGGWAHFAEHYCMQINFLEDYS